MYELANNTMVIGANRSFYMSSTDWEIYGIFAFLFVVAIPTMLRVCRGDIRNYEKPQSWWLYSPKAWKRFVASWPVLYLVVLGMITTLGLTEVNYGLAEVVALATAVLGFCGLAIIFFGHPRFLIPRTLRAKTLGFNVRGRST